MEKSSELLKSIVEKHGLDFGSSYAGALKRLVEMLDEELAGVLFQRVYENTEKAVLQAEEAQKHITRDMYRLESKFNALQELVKKAETIIEAASAISDKTIKDPQDAKTLILYKSLLSAGVETFGEDRMSDEAISSICDSASYITWRTVMGPKNVEAGSDWPSRPAKRV